MAKPFIVVGSKPPRPHYFASHLRLEVFNGHPAIRLRDEDGGLIHVMSCEQLRSTGEAMLQVAEKMEQGAGAQATDLLNKLIGELPKKGAPDGE